MSKKLAEGLDGLVLDVKVGRGAFMKRPEESRTLAETMVGIGRSYGTPVRALLTDMNQPLGGEVGNACEVVESVEVLRGGGPADLVEVTYRLGEEMLVLGGVAADRAEARARLERAVASGAAFEKLVEVVEAQGGDPAVIHDPSLLPVAPHHHEVPAARSGYLTRCDALDLGVAAMRLGAGTGAQGGRHRPRRRPAGAGQGGRPGGGGPAPGAPGLGRLRPPGAGPPPGGAGPGDRRGAGGAAAPDPRRGLLRGGIT